MCCDILFQAKRSGSDSGHMGLGNNAKNPFKLSLRNFKTPRLLTEILRAPGQYNYTPILLERACNYLLSLLWLLKELSISFFFFASQRTFFSEFRPPWILGLFFTTKRTIIKVINVLKFSMSTDFCSLSYIVNNLLFKVYFIFCEPLPISLVQIRQG